MLKEWVIFTCSLLTLTGASLPLSGCISRGQESISKEATFEARVLREPGTTKEADTKDLNAPPSVYGPSQVMFHIDDNHYFTLENYTRCENEQTFYSNKAKNIHVKILDTSGYLFRNRLFWLSTRDGFLAFPATLNTRHASCMGSSRGCTNTVIVTTGGGERRSGVPYGSYTQDPAGAVRNYDMLVMNDGFYLLRYRGRQGRFSPVILRWILSTKDSSGVVRSEDAYELFRPEEEASSTGFCKIDLSRLYPKNNVTEMQCDRTLEPVQPSEDKIQ